MILVLYMEKTTDERELNILKIIGKHPEIHHRELLRIILDKSLMAKKTAEKNIKNLLHEKRIFAYKYGKEIQYVLADNELSEKDLKNKVSKTVKKFKFELDKIEKDFDKFDFYFKRNFPDHLSQVLHHLVDEKSHLLRYAKENKHNDMSFALELLDEINKLSKTLPKNDTVIQEKITLSGELVTNIDKSQRKYAELLQKRNNMATSKKRENISQTLRLMNDDLSKLYYSLEKIRDDLKNYR